MNYIKPKQFNFSNVKGLTYNQLYQHYQLYKGYVNSTNKVRESLEDNSIYENPSATYSNLRCAVKAQTFAINGVKLHQLYFENLTGNNTIPYGFIEKLIINRYGSYEEFKNRFKSTGLSVRGWVTLSIDPIDNELYIYGQDAHDNGVVLKAFPLIVLDVYEHAYMIDYGIDRKKYIDVFFNNLDYKVVNKRLKDYFIRNNKSP